MKRSGQRGQTLVELIVGLAVGGIVLAAIAGVLFTVSDNISHWGERVAAATDGFALAGQLQADSLRYPLCQQSQSQLEFCLPTKDAALKRCPTAVTYSLVRSGVVRQTPGGGQVLMAESNGKVPVFSVRASTSNGVMTGTIMITNVRTATRVDPAPGAVVVPFRSPAGSC